MAKKTNDPYVQKLDEAVTEAKKNREWRHEYMTLLMRDMENIEKGRMEGRKEGREEGRRENRKQVAEKMLEEKIDAEIIIKVTSLTEQELKQIEKNMLVSL